MKLPPLPPGFELEGPTTGTAPPPAAASAAPVSDLPLAAAPEDGQVVSAPAPTPAAQVAGTAPAALPPLPAGFEIEEPEDPLLARLSAMSQFGTGEVDAKSRYNIALRKVREQFPGISDEKWQEYSSKFLAPYDGKDLAQQGQTFGFGDEVNAGMGAVGSQVGNWLHGDGPGYGDAYDANYELEQARLALGREQQGARGTAMEVLGGMSTMGPAKAIPAATAPAAATGSRIVQGMKSLAAPMAGGAAYGFGSTDGDVGERLQAAGTGAALGVAAGIAAPITAKVVQGTARRVAGIPAALGYSRAIKQAVETAPAAAAIRAGSKAAYDAAEATGATIGQKAMHILAFDIEHLAKTEGLLLPSGKLSTAFPKVANAVRTLREYAQGPMTIKEGQTLLKTLRTAQKSADPDEARLGSMMVDEFDSFLDSLPSQAFISGNGDEAIVQWGRGRVQWARAKRTETIENIMHDARMHDGGFARGLRAGFKDILKSKNAKKRRGFSVDDIEAMRDFVDGGPLQDLMARIGNGSGLPGVGVGGLTGGPVGAVAVPIVGGLARRESNRQAAKVAEQLRAQVATPGGLPQRPLRALGSLPAGLNALGAMGSGALLASTPRPPSH